MDHLNADLARASQSYRLAEAAMDRRHRDVVAARRLSRRAERAAALSRLTRA